MKSNGRRREWPATRGVRKAGVYGSYMGFRALAQIELVRGSPRNFVLRVARFAAELGWSLVVIGISSKVE
jgi:hypothetical protein